MDPEEKEGVSTPAEDVSETVEFDEDETEAEEVETEEAEEADADDTDPEPDAEEDDDSVVVTIGDEPEPETEKAPAWVKDLRKKEREQRKRIRELESKLEEKAKSALPDLGPKPTLESADYDEDRFAEELTQWHERKRQVETRKQAEAERAKAEQEAWSNRLSEYDSRKKALKVGDFDDAEAAVTDALNVTQQGIILQGAKDPEVLIYGLGKYPGKLKELAAITDPVKFAFAVANLEGKLSVKPRTPKTAPEKRVTPSAGTGASTDSTLEKLREKAARTGDMSEVIAYKKKLRAAGK